MVSLDRRFVCQTVYSCCSFCVLSLAIIIAAMCFEIRNDHLGAPIEVEGAQRIGLDWQKQPFVDIKSVLATVEDDEPCGFGFEEMIFGVWQGLKEVCFCQEGSSLESVYGQGACRGKAANSPYCRTRRALPPVIMPRLSGFKYCGRRSGSSFLNAVRP